eukprot:scaffold11885_cov129-Isochrysis_galbana.AAC.1
MFATVHAAGFVSSRFIHFVYNLRFNKFKTQSRAFRHKAFSRFCGRQTYSVGADGIRKWTPVNEGLGALLIREMRDGTRARRRESRSRFRERLEHSKVKHRRRR